MAYLASWVMKRKTSWPLVLGVGEEQGGDREAVAARKEWASYCCVPQGIGPVSRLGFWLSQ
jgi:hypothetical protein